MIGMREILVQKPVTSPMSSLLMMTVNMGDELFTVSTNEMADCVRAIRPRIMENSRSMAIIVMFFQNSKLQ